MSGQILFTTVRDVKLYLPFCIRIAAAWLMLPSLRKGLGFYFMFALTITATVQLIGIYVVFASLILPALVTFGKRKPLLYAWLFSAASMLMGIGFSALIDAPTGPMIVTTYVIFGILITLTNWAIQMKRE